MIPTVTKSCQLFPTSHLEISGNLSWHILSDILFWHSISHSSLIFYSGILPGIYSNILSGILSCIYSDIVSAFYLAFFLAIFLAFYLAFYLTFYSIWHLFWHSVAPFHLAFILTSSLTWALPTKVWSSRLRSGSAHCDLVLAVGRRRRTRRRRSNYDKI